MLRTKMVLCTLSIGCDPTNCVCSACNNCTANVVGFSIRGADPSGHLLCNQLVFVDLTINIHPRYGLCAGTPECPAAAETVDIQLVWEDPANPGVPVVPIARGVTQTFRGGTTDLERVYSFREMPMDAALFSTLGGGAPSVSLDLWIEILEKPPFGPGGPTWVSRVYAGPHEFRCCEINPCEEYNPISRNCIPRQCGPCDVCNPVTDMCENNCNSCELCDPVFGCVQAISCPPGETCNPSAGSCECFGQPSCPIGEFCDPITMQCQPNPTGCIPPCPPGEYCDPVLGCQPNPPVSVGGDGKGTCFWVAVVGAIAGFALVY